MIIQEEFNYQNDIDPNQTYRVKKITEESNVSVSFKQKELAETTPNLKVLKST